MAQVFPLNAPTDIRDPARSALLDTLAGLPDGWTLLAGRVLGEVEPVGAVLIHPEIGVALVDVAPRDLDPAVAALTALFARERLAEFFPGELPVVAVSVPSEELATIGERLAEAFEGAPSLGIADRDWSDAAIELLLTPSDVAMAPTGDRAEAPGLPGPDIPSRFDPAPPAASQDPAAFAPSGADAPLPRRREAAEIPVAPLRAEAQWRLVEGDPPRRRHGRLVAAALALLLLAGVAGLGLGVESGTFPLPAPTAALDRPVEAALAPARTLSKAPNAAEAATPDRPPPVPAAPPVMLAAKPLAPPPPRPPKTTQVAALPKPKPPVVLAAKPFVSPPPRAPKPTHVAALPKPKPPVVMAAKPLAAPPPHAPKPTRVAALPEARPIPPPPPKPAPVETAENQPVAAAATKKPRTDKAQAAPAARSLRRDARGGTHAQPLRPPIDATDLPPLDASAPNPTVAAAPPPAPTRQSAAPPPALASAGATTPPRPVIGPPRRLIGRPAVTQEAADQQRECRPYTASSTLTGRGMAVQGIACRGADGKWRLVSEVPLR